jgi:glycogen debranching enzyme
MVPMVEPWSVAPPQEASSHAQPVTLVEGSTFCICGGTGDIRTASDGLYVRDTRVVSRWELTVDGVAPLALAAQQEVPYAATFIGRLPPEAGLADSRVVVVRRRYVGQGMREDLTLANSGPDPVSCEVALHVGVDFADVFEVKEGRVFAPPTGVPSPDPRGQLEASRTRNGRTHGLLVRGDAAGLRPGRLQWEVTIPGRGEWRASAEAVPVEDGRPLRLRHPRGTAVEHAAPARRLRAWRRHAPAVHTRDAGLRATLWRSGADVGMLRIFDPEHPDRPVVAAGAPWFMALFGRDALLTSWMLLPIDAGLALGTLQTLADHQGRDLVARTEEEPGRILHELRFGPAATLALGGRNAYYGTADATPLFVMLLGELRRWGLHEADVRTLLPHADRALDWIRRHGDADGDGFVEYLRKTPTGLANQGWKDSWDGVTFASGAVAQPPIALAEVQAYTFAAYVARSHFATEDGDIALARKWADRAAELKQAFNERFWLPDRGWFALGLDAAKRPIDALASNMGHCLWTGIVDEDKAAAVADGLLSEEMFSGWGIRTLATSMGAYNPVSYHNGSVWPHDNAICVAGLMRYGFVEHAQRVATALFDAAQHFGNRLPELFCGFPRDEFPAPVPYPTSCTPQAWASAAPMLLLRALLRFDPQGPGGALWCAPALPERFCPLRVSNLAVCGSTLTIDVTDRDTWEVTGLAPGQRLLRQPRPPGPSPAGRSGRPGQ